MEDLLNKKYSLMNIYKSPQIMFSDLNIRKEELLAKYEERIKTLDGLLARILIHSLDL